MKHAYILATKEQLHNLNVKQPKTALKTEKRKKQPRTSWFHRAARVEPMKNDCLEPLEESITPSSSSYSATPTQMLEQLRLAQKVIQELSPGQIR